MGVEELKGMVREMVRDGVQVVFMDMLSPCSGQDCGVFVMVFIDMLSLQGG